MWAPETSSPQEGSFGILARYVLRVISVHGYMSGYLNKFIPFKM